jgi:hypothetical protein
MAHRTLQTLLMKHHSAAGRISLLASLTGKRGDRFAEKPFFQRLKKQRGKEQCPHGLHF